MYKIGDKVKIRTDLEINKEYGCGYVFMGEMDKYRGKIATIVNRAFNAYFIDLDEGKWDWTDDMFEYKYDYNYKIYVNDTKIAITDGVNTKEYINYSQESLSIALNDFLTLGLWRPDLGQAYYTVDEGLSTVVPNIWDNDCYDNSHYKHGLVCKTEEEAKKLLDCMKKAVVEFRNKS